MAADRAPTSLRTLALTEWRPRDCRLTPADVEFLLAEHRPHLELLPTGRRGRYRLTPGGYAGVIVAPHCRLVIRPKVPLQSLFYLLDPLAPLPLVEDHTTADPGTAALAFLAARLAQLVEQRAAAGLQRGYAERTEQGPFLQGRLDLPAQVAGGPRKDLLHCRYEDFSVDIPCNQVLRATLELLLRSPLVTGGVRGLLRQALRHFEAVRSVPLGPDSFTVEPGQLVEGYRPLFELCKLLVESLTPGEVAGPTACPGFLLDMERVFERYLTEGVVQAFAGAEGHTVAVQPLYLVNEPVPGQPDVRMRPDVLILRGGRPRLVVDAKWKRLRDGPLVTADVYQMLAYCAGLGVDRAVLVYPGRRDRVWGYTLARAPVAIEVRTLRVVGDGEKCARSLRRLGVAVAGQAAQSG
jgi:5-methylcytosine-specific restriction enzyme subunit McrC